MDKVYYGSTCMSAIRYETPVEAYVPFWTKEKRGRDRDFKGEVCNSQVGERANIW